MERAEGDALTRRALAGDSDALGALLESFRPLVQYIAYSCLTRFRMERFVEDVTQDVFADAVAAFRNYDPAWGNLYPMLKQIAQWRLRHWLRDNRILLHEVPLERQLVDEDDDAVVNRTDPVALAAWMHDEQAEYGRPPLQTPQSDPTRRRPITKRRGRPVKPKGVVKEPQPRKRQPVPEEVLYRRAQFVAGASVADLREQMDSA